MRALFQSQTHSHSHLRNVFYSRYWFVLRLCRRSLFFFFSSIFRFVFFFCVFCFCRSLYISCFCSVSLYLSEVFVFFSVCFPHSLPLCMCNVPLFFYQCLLLSSFLHINTYSFAKGRSRLINYNFIIVLLFRLYSVSCVCLRVLARSLVYLLSQFLLLFFGVKHFILSFILSYPRDWYAYFSDNFQLEMTKIYFFWTFESLDCGNGWLALMLMVLLLLFFLFLSCIYNPFADACNGCCQVQKTIRISLLFNRLNVFCALECLMLLLFLASSSCFSSFSSPFRSTFSSHTAFLVRTGLLLTKV